MSIFERSYSYKNLVFLLRIPEYILNSGYYTNVYKTINILEAFGFSKIEIAYSDNKNWKNLLINLKKDYPNCNIGAASLKSINDLYNIQNLNLEFYMMPVFDKNTIQYSYLNNINLIPAINNKEDFEESINLKCNIKKIYPAKKLGINFAKNIMSVSSENTINIAAGGFCLKDIHQWIDLGFNYIILGREVFNSDGFSLKNNFLEELNELNII